MAGDKELQTEDSRRRKGLKLMVLTELNIERTQKESQSQQENNPVNNSKGQ
jgi:hypothetical protein